VLDATSVSYRAGNHAANRVKITRSGRVVTIDDAVAIKAGKGCKAVKGDRTKVRCTTAKKTSIIWVRLGDRNDTLINGTGIGVNVQGGSGNDTLIGGSGRDFLGGDNGKDLLFGRGGDDTLGGDSGDDELYGGVGNDVLYGANGNDELFGDNGDDRLYGDNGNDELHGDNGDDRVDGGAGDDQLFGEDGNDHVLGGAGNDRLYGGQAEEDMANWEFLDGGANRTKKGDFCAVGAHTVRKNCER
jgi:Ca2+-binding RTX toxin-like protein